MADVPRPRTETANVPDGGCVCSDAPVVVVGGGWFSLSRLRALVRRGFRIVAADGGANGLLRTDLVPEAIIGDLDSLDSPGLWRSRCRLIHVREQETTDFAKVISRLRAPLVVGMGVVGPRLDHAFAALNVLARHPGRRIVLQGQDDLLWAIHGPVSVSLPAGSRLSLWPLGPVRFCSSSGLRYPLDGLCLAPDGTCGVSNTVCASPVSIVPESGSRTACIVITDADLLDCWLAMGEHTVSGGPC